MNEWVDNKKSIVIHGCRSNRLNCEFAKFADVIENEGDVESVVNGCRKVLNLQNLRI